MKQPFRVLIVDDHEHAREAMRQILAMDSDFELVGEAVDGHQAIELTEKWMPDLILMDIQMTGMDGLEATKRIKDRFPYVKIVMVTVSDDSRHLFEALKKGAQGYLLKSLQASSWLTYLHAVAVDETPMSQELANRILQEFAFHTARSFEESPLTPREQDILGWVAKGSSNREIAEHLAISEHTVKNHLKNILPKLHLNNRMQLMRYAYEKGLVKPE